MKKARNLVLGMLIALGIGGVAVYSWQSKQSLAYAQCLEEEAFSVNEEVYFMHDLGYYITYEERLIEEQAKLYNPNNTRDYWNLHVDGTFIQADAKKTVMEMAIHDAYFYQLAQAEGLSLNAQEQQDLENAIGDFWMDLLDEQVERMPVSDEYIVEAMQKSALAQKYQTLLAKKEGHSISSYNWDGYYYQQLIAGEDVQINDKIWDRITMGNITLSHGSPNYINGHESSK